MLNIESRYNESNEIIKYKFYKKLEHSDGKDPKTVNQYTNAIHEFELALNFYNFKEFNSEWAIKFKDHLNNKVSKVTGTNISKSTYFHYLSHVKEFFKWLKEADKEYYRVKSEDINFFNISKNDRNKAKATNHQESHLVKDILSTIRNMPEKTILEKRNKAIISLCLLTTPRISSLQTSRIKSLKYFDDYEIWALIQHPSFHDTKYSKNITSFFIGQSHDIIENVIKWRDFLISEGFKDHDYLFPKILSGFASGGGNELRLTKEGIKSQTQIRDSFKYAFKSNGLVYRKPHSFRHSITRTIQKLPNATELLIAMAENLGHKSGMATIIGSYGGNNLAKQAELIKGINLEK